MLRRTVVVFEFLLLKARFCYIVGGAAAATAVVYP